MSKHTHGEWFSHREGRSTVYVEARIGRGLLQEVAACGPTAGGSDEQEANARLIASAPELLAALQAAANYIDTLGGNSESYRGAIAKATWSQS